MAEGRERISTPILKVWNLTGLQPRAPNWRSRRPVPSSSQPPDPAPRATAVGPDLDLVPGARGRGLGLTWPVPRGHPGLTPRGCRGGAGDFGTRSTCTVGHEGRRGDGRAAPEPSGTEAWTQEKRAKGETSPDTSRRAEARDIGVPLDRARPLAPWGEWPAPGSPSPTVRRVSARPQRRSRSATPVPQLLVVRRASRSLAPPPNGLRPRRRWRQRGAELPAPRAFRSRDPGPSLGLERRRAEGDFSAGSRRRGWPRAPAQAGPPRSSGALLRRCRRPVTYPGV